MRGKVCFGQSAYAVAVLVLLNNRSAGNVDVARVLS